MKPHKNRAYIIPLLAGLLFCIPAGARAEMLTGAVVSIDEQQRMFTLNVENTTPSGPNAKNVVVTVPGSGSLTYAGRRTLPGCVQKGESVRVWGDFSLKDENTFLATAIRGTGGRSRHDPTGVRARLGTCRKGNREPGRCKGKKDHVPADRKGANR